MREVSQSEHEQISTRVLTNYNHMHALSIQYYEIVQAFRTTTQLERAERCLFVPVKLVDFTNPGLVDRWRLRLADVALTERARRQLTVEYGVVEIIPQTPPVRPGKIIIDPVPLPPTKVFVPHPAPPAASGMVEVFGTTVPGGWRGVDRRRRRGRRDRRRVRGGTHVRKGHVSSPAARSRSAFASSSRSRTSSASWSNDVVSYSAPLRSLASCLLLAVAASARAIRGSSVIRGSVTALSPARLSPVI